MDLYTNYKDFDGIITNILFVCSISLIIGCAQKNFTDRVVPEEKDGIYTIQVQNQILEIDPAEGGRITSLKLNGKIFLTNNDVNNFNWGSTFWPSPQSEWNWPPSAELDNKPYSVEVVDNEVIMVSQKDPGTGFVVTKKFSGNKKSGYYLLKYTITNKSDKPRKVAPWEVTRVQTNGITFFPMGKGERTGGLEPLTLEKDGIIWFDYDGDKLPLTGNRQLYSDGADGWLAQVNGDVILVKEFKDLPLEKKAPKEGEIELFASEATPDKSYIEIEQQGAYEKLLPGASLTWEVIWYLRALPANVRSKVGDISLVTYVRDLIK
jgi:hypothetical protein